MEEKQELPEKQIGKKTGTINRTLLELLAGILFWGVVCQAVGVWMVKDKPGYSIGLWIGVLLALLAGTHMWWALDRFLGYAGDAAVKMITKHNIIRYVAIVVVMALGQRVCESAFGVSRADGFESSGIFAAVYS